MSDDSGHRRHCVAVIGRGPGFDERFGTALEAAGLWITDLTLAARSRVEVVMASTLDGWRPEQGLPELADGLPWVVLAEDATALEPNSPETVVVSPRISPEALVFTLCNLIFEVSDRRRGARVMAPVLVRYRLVDDHIRPVVFSAELANLGLGGGFVRSLRPPPVGTGILLEIVAGDAPEPLLLGGRVVHAIEPDLEAGIVCSSHDPERRVPSHPGFALAFDPPPSDALRSRLQRLAERLGSGG